MFPKGLVSAGNVNKGRLCKTLVTVIFVTKGSLKNVDVPSSSIVLTIIILAEGVNVISVTVLIKVILITVPELETLATLLILEIAIDNLSIDSFKISVDGIYDSVSWTSKDVGIEVDDITSI